MKGFRILVTRGMYGLGTEKDAINKEFARWSAARCDYIILVGDSETQALRESLREAAFPEDRQYVASDLKDAVQHMYEKAEPDSVVLLETELTERFKEEERHIS